MENQSISLGKYVSIIHRHSRIYIDEKLKPYGLSGGQAFYLMALYHHDGIRQEDLCKSINIDKGTTARALKKLESLGYVTRQRHSSDKRAYSIHLTEKAQEFKSEFRKIHSDWTEILSKDLTGPQKEAALQLLEILAKNAVNEIFELHSKKEREHAK